MIITEFKDKKIDYRKGFRVKHMHKNKKNLQRGDVYEAK
jgi:hypothetical protein